MTTQFRIDGRLVVEVLGAGRQTVLPPSAHPDTGRSYVWTGTKTLLDEAPPAVGYSELVAIIEQVLAPFGYQREGTPRRGDTEAAGASNIDGLACGRDDADSPWRALNDAALGRLDAWVDAMKLYNCIRKHDGSYAAVATWRPSSGGRPTEQRKRNLGINPKGIKDFGTGQSYSPIDLVMAALGSRLCGGDRLA